MAAEATTSGAGPTRSPATRSPSSVAPTAPPSSTSPTLENPVYLGNLPSHSGSSSWRDIKTFADHAFVVADGQPHGIQVFDLTQLRSVTSPPVTFSATTHYDQIGNAHNIVINEATGFAYAVGSNECSGGLYMVDVNTPTSPTFAGCFSADGYTHDAQCIVYDGPDTQYTGSEICFASNEDTLTIVDVTNKSNPVQLSRVDYTQPGNSHYAHQGWLTEDRNYFVFDDEFDEMGQGHNTRTYVWDVSDLDAPTLTGSWDAAGSSVDHNQYIRGNFTYQANYARGLRILELTDLANAGFTEVGFFDTYPESDGNNFDGAWSTYPFFASGTVLVSDINRGLFILRPQTTDPNNAPVVNITAPVDGSSSTVGDSVTFAGTANDTEDGDITGDLAWSSSIDGSLGTGAGFSTSALGVGSHTITASVTDSGGQPHGLRQRSPFPSTPVGGGNGPQNAVYDSGLGAPRLCHRRSVAPATRPGCSTVAPAMAQRRSRAQPAEHPRRLHRRHLGLVPQRTNPTIASSSRTLDSCGPRPKAPRCEIEATVWAWTTPVQRHPRPLLCGRRQQPELDFHRPRSHRRPWRVSRRCLTTTYTLPTGCAPGNPRQLPLPGFSS